MRNFILIFIISFLTHLSYSQNKKSISIARMSNGDTSLWYKWRNEAAVKLKLPLLITNGDSFYFRFWTDKQVVDIWSKDRISYNGLITNYTNTYNDGKKKRKPSKIPFSKKTLEDSLIRKVLELTKQINKIPTDDSIKGWHSGLDGVEYIFETSTPQDYCFKEYWTPRSQDSSVMEAKIIQSFVDSLSEILALKDRYEAFFETLKPGSYIGDGPIIRTKVKPLTRKQIAYNEKMKPYRDYLASINNSLNQYLSDTLSKILLKPDKLECDYNFYLKFSKENKLIKVITFSEFIDEEDKLEFKQCRNNIIEAFKLIRIDFVHSKINYWKELHFNGKEVTIR